MKYGVDMSYPPTVGQAQAMADLGWSFCGVYVGGPRALPRKAWQQIDGSRYPVRDLVAVFAEFIPIYVGRNTGDDPANPWDGPDRFTIKQGKTDGDEANRDTGSCGFGSDTPLFLDLEYGTYQAHPVATTRYCEGWVEQVNRAGHKAGLYSDPETLRALGHPELFDITWGASWYSSMRGTQTPPYGRFDPATPPPWHMWQFAGSILAGVSVDLNSCSDDVVLAKYG